MKGQIPQRMRRSRRSRLLALQQKVSRERLSRRIGETMTVMVDGPATSGRGSVSWAARTPGQAFEVDGGVIVEGDSLVPGERVPVRITGASAYDLFARHEAATSELRVLRGA
jgi:ribosomal protein S12 methylthiotransferase